MKQCKHCKQIKELGEFARNRARRDGLQKWCKVCQKDYRQTHPKDDHAIWLKTKQRRFARMLNAS